MLTLTQGEDLSSVTDELSGLSLSDWVWAGSIILASFLIAFIFRKLLARAWSDPDSSYATHVIARLISYVIVVFGLVYALGQIGVSVGPLLGALGVVGLALAFAFQDILENFIAGILMVLRRPFTIGDQITTNDYSGTVEDVTLRSMAMRTYAGERVYVPNAMVWKNPIVNHTELGQRRTTIEVGVAYDTDLDEAAAVLRSAASSIDDVSRDHPVEVFVHNFGASSIDFAVRFWHEPQKSVEWATRDRVARALKNALDEAGIEIPFPQRVVHMKDSATS
ncbi:MAG: mechanosensitive ion channel family protein [Acidimicrobiia bacterium]|nr:mechanosensitive ion channel family protein [Acidimicrobiia bacterium]